MASTTTGVIYALIFFAYLLTNRIIYCIFAKHTPIRGCFCGKHLTLYGRQKRNTEGLVHPSRVRKEIAKNKGLGKPTG